MVDRRLRGSGNGRGDQARVGTPELEKMAAGELTKAKEAGSGGERRKGIHRGC